MVAASTIALGIIAQICLIYGTDGAITLYHFGASPPSRIVRMTGAVLGINFDEKIVNIMENEQMKPEFIKVNPLHTVPTIVDGDLTLYESRAIAAYLVNKYAKDDSLYPKDPMKRAIVDQRLYFDMGTLYDRFLAVYKPMIFMKQPYNEENGKKLTEAFDVFEMYLKENEWAAGNQMTIADLSLVSTVSTAEAMGYDFSKYPMIMKWYAKSKAKIPNYKEVNQDGADVWKQFAAKIKM